MYKRTLLQPLSALFCSAFLTFSACSTSGELHTFPSEPVLPPVEVPITPELPQTPPMPTTPEAPISPNAPLEEGVWDLGETDISNVDQQRKLIALTFDDAPHKTLENILAVFAAYNEQNPDCPACATVFCNGIFFDNDTRQLLSVASAMGFELGNHTYSHKDLTTLSESDIRSEIDKTDALLEKIDGKTRHLFRAPFGKLDERVKAAVATPIIDWTIDTLDWTGASESSVYDSVFKGKFSGAIALMHDGYEGSVDALKRLLPDLKKAGYQAVSVSQMAKAHGCALRCGSVYIRARKQTK